MPTTTSTTPEPSDVAPLDETDSVLEAGAMASDDGISDRTRRRHPRQVAVAIGVVALVGVAGFALGRTIKSPADIAASREPPDPSPITVAVESRVLTSSLVLRGTTRSAGATPVSLAGVVGGDAERVVVTVAPRPGDQAVDGSPLLQVSGRPVFAIQGQQPGYRALGIGSRGQDVAQLETALGRWGFDPGSVDGLFDLNTASAVVRWYESRGFTANGYDGRSAAGVTVPAGEIVFLPQLPRTIESVEASVGDEGSGPLLTLAGTGLVIDLGVNQADLQALVVNQAAEIEIGDGLPIDGTVHAIASQPGGDLVTDPTRYHVEVVPEEPASDVVPGTPAKVTIPIATTEGAVLVVPLAAVTTTADGSSRVEVLSSQGVFRQVEVTLGLAAAGFVEVRPKAGAQLEAGARVVVGLAE